MALKRSFLESMGLTEAQISAIMDEHTAVTDRMKKEIDQYKADADKLPSVQKELDALKGGEDYKAKYDKLHQDFEDYKTQVARDADAAKVRSEFRKLLTEEKISDKRLDAICKVTDFSAMKLDKDGSLHDAEKIRNEIKKDWGEFITETRERGVNVETPPGTGKGTMTKAEILAIKDTGERQKAIAENLNLFGH